MSDYSIKGDDFEFELNATDLDIVAIDQNGNGEFHILKNQKSYRAKVLSADHSTKTFVLEINNTPYQVQIADQYDQLVKKLGLGTSGQQQANDIKAPMPGLVLEVSVEVGQSVEVGDALVILEAMKMENVIKSVGTGVIKSIQVEKGAAVEKGQLLIEMESA